MLKQFGPAIKITLFFTVLTGIIYPAVVTGLCQLLFRNQANGSLVSVNGQVVGSSLLGQNFAKPEYFQPRPSAAGNDGYDPTASAGSNLGPTNQKLIDRVKASLDKFHKDNPDFSGPVPSDLVTASGSGLDPDLSPASALAQAPRIAKARAASVDAIRELISNQTQSRQLGVLGEPRVNVLALNMKLDEQFPKK
jgi:K+-transporting ATPase ATPase C chain